MQWKGWRWSSDGNDDDDGDDRDDDDDDDDEEEEEDDDDLASPTENENEVEFFPVCLHPSMLPSSHFTLSFYISSVHIMLLLHITLWHHHLKAR